MATRTVVADGTSVITYTASNGLGSHDVSSVLPGSDNTVNENVEYIVAPQLSWVVSNNPGGGTVQTYGQYSVTITPALFGWTLDYSANTNLTDTLFDGTEAAAIAAARAAIEAL